MLHYADNTCLTGWNTVTLKYVNILKLTIFQSFMLCNIWKLFPFYLWALQGRKRWNKDGPLTSTEYFLVLSLLLGRDVQIFIYFTFSIRQGHLHHLNSIALFMLRRYQYVFMCIYMPCCFISDLSWIFSATQVNKLIQNTQKVSLEYFTPWKFKNQLLVVLEASFQECMLCLDGASASSAGIYSKNRLPRKHMALYCRRSLEAVHKIQNTKHNIINI